MNQKIYVVTGSNKGIGYGIVKGLAKKVSGGIIYLTARNVTLGEKAQQNLLNELTSEKKSDVLFHQLDITDEKSCNTFADHLKKKHNGLDVLINNAGFAFDNAATESPEHQAEITIGINYYGTKLISSVLEPLIRENGRVINVCSQLGIMKNRYSTERIKKFQNPNITENDIEEFIQEYKKAAKDNKRKEMGFPESAYSVSKTAEIAFTIIQNSRLASRNIIVNGCCPGYVNTDMTNHKGPLTIDQGADTPIYLATEPISSQFPRGKFLFERKVMDWNKE